MSCRLFNHLTEVRLLNRKNATGLWNRCRGSPRSGAVASPSCLEMCIALRSAYSRHYDNRRSLRSHRRMIIVIC